MGKGLPSRAMSGFLVRDPISSTSAQSTYHLRLATPKKEVYSFPRGPTVGANGHLCLSLDRAYRFRLRYVVR